MADPRGATAARGWQALLGMGLVPCSVFPHYGERWEELVRERAPGLDHPLVQLADFTGELWVGSERRRVLEAPQDAPDSVATRPKFG